MSAVREAGTRLSRLGRYELITEIGQGGMAEVQLALQHGPAGFEKLVVVKLVHANLASQKAFVDMLLDEARVAALVKHPNVVDIYDLGEAEGRYFIAMEYLEGEPLLAVLRAGRDGKRLDPLSTARLISDTAEGLDAAHELRTMAGEPLELVHHDVSLGNIVVLYNGQVKLVDFGVAKATQSAATQTKVQGKFSYMAPEKLRGGSGDRRSDIWSLGCVLWEALTLKRLFKGGNDHETMKQVLEATVLAPSLVNPVVSADFDPIVLRALDRDPAKRYPTAKAFAVDIEEVLRTHGYGGRNDLIAKYMQATFENHIAARKKLLQEVSSKGRASTEVLAAAFHEPPRRPASTTSSGDFSVRFRRPSSELLALPDATPPPAGELPRARTQTSQRLVAPAPASRRPTAHGDSPANRALIFAIGSGAIIAMIVGAIVMATHHHGAAATAPRVADARTAIAIGDDAPPAPARVAPQPVAVPEVRADIPLPPARPADGASAADLYRAGLRAFVHGDTKSALGSLEQATQLNPSFAPTWRALGLVHEKLGDRPAAKAAYQRYLDALPSASDAQQIRIRMEAL